MIKYYILILVGMQKKESNSRYIKKFLPFYQKQEDYEKLRKKMSVAKEPKYLIADIREIDKHVADTFDFIDLSNIIDSSVAEELCTINVCGRSEYEVKTILKKEWLEFVYSTIVPLLNQNGTIIVNNRIAFESFDRPDLLFRDDSLKKYPVPSKRDGQHDVIFTYKKTR
jgi:hypothetical protein